MKLLIFIYSLQCGGAERVTANLADYWTAKGWQVTVVTLTSSEPDYYRLHHSVRRIGLDLAQESKGWLDASVKNLRRTLSLRKVLKQLQPDVALAMMSNSCILLALAAVAIKGVVSVGSEHTHPPNAPMGNVWGNFRKWLYGLLDAVVVLTRESATWLHANTRARRVAIIPNAAQWPLPKQLPQLPPPARVDGQRILLAVGRLTTEKGFDLLLPVFQQLVAEFPNWRLVILGEGPKNEALQMQISTLGVSEHVSLPGRVGNMAQWYAAADLYVMTSRFEGFPNTLVEALAHGLPAVSFDCDTGPRDIIRHEINGLLVPAGDCAALKTALQKLMVNETLRRQFANRAIEVRDRYTIERIAGLWERLFRELRNGP